MSEDNPNTYKNEKNGLKEAEAKRDEIKAELEELTAPARDLALKISKAETEANLMRSRSLTYDKKRRKYLEKETIKAKEYLKQLEEEIKPKKEELEKQLKEAEKVEEEKREEAEEAEKSKIAKETEINKTPVGVFTLPPKEATEEREEVKKAETKEKYKGQKSLQRYVFNTYQGYVSEEILKLAKLGDIFIKEERENGQEKTIKAVKEMAEKMGGEIKLRKEISDYKSRRAPRIQIGKYKYYFIKSKEKTD